MNSPNLIALSGQAGSGKTTIAELIVAERDSWEIRSFSGKLKQIAAVLLDVDPRKFEDPEFKKSKLDTEWDYLVWDGTCLGGDCLEPEVRSMTIRMFLQKLGTDAIRDGLHPNTWINLLFKDFYNDELYAFLAKDDVICYNTIKRWVIPDVRFANEFEAIKQRGGVCIRVDRPGLPEDPHQSEQEWRGFEFDWVIDNSGSLDDLRKKVQLFIQHFFPGNS